MARHTDGTATTSSSTVAAATAATTTTNNALHQLVKEMANTAGSMSIAEGGGQLDQEVLDLFRRELRAEYATRLQLDYERSCRRIDELVLSVLRQLPPEIRTLNASEALSMGFSPTNILKGLLPPRGPAPLCHH
eukprot:CAMPEP_0206556042 /NCGR_PEP_ID=MMETSP0325_2-20121206/18177_1 /ASSEMBLY_ACC=CAM_ASM_000347 /TAXON_ID=2866 /ORGANISM="Crypthecodinium cohnii, Strain Seligo" /LENGTH=133 /DNA_ID=CAMNT_0054056505 /DNA_START=48 /DNA_END=449 /DNA_ORIENTATION=-